MLYVIAFIHSMLKCLSVSHSKGQHGNYDVVQVHWRKLDVD